MSPRKKAPTGPGLFGAQDAGLAGSPRVRTYDELATLEFPPPPRDRGTVRLIVLRIGDGAHRLPQRATVTVEKGILGDRWDAGPKRHLDKQVTLMDAAIEAAIRAGRAPGDPGDNFLVDFDLSHEALPAGTRLRIGTAVIEISESPHTGCAKFKARFGADALRWINEQPELRRRGVNCRVVEGGEVAVGDEIVRV